MAHRPSHSQSLLPNPDSLILDRIERDADRFLFMVSVKQKPARPICGEVIHGENDAAASSARVAITALTGSGGPIPNRMPSITRPRKPFADSNAMGNLEVPSGLRTADRRVAMLHVNSAMPNFVVHEVSGQILPGPRDKIWQEWFGFPAIRMADGRFPLAQNPGLGFDVTEEESRQIPVRRHASDGACVSRKRLGRGVIAARGNYDSACRGDDGRVTVRTQAGTSVRISSVSACCRELGW